MISQTKVGILFFVGLGLALWFTIFVADLGGGGGTYHVRFNRILNLRQGDPVLYNGLKIGVIRSISPELEGGRSFIGIHFDIDETFRSAVLVNDATRFTISQSLLGGSELNILTDGPGAPVTPGMMQGRFGEDPASLQDAIARFNQLIDENRESIRRFVDLLPGAVEAFAGASQNVREVVAENRAALALAVTSFGKTSDGIGKLVEENREKVTAAIEGLQGAATQIRDTVAENREALKTAVGRLPTAVEDLGKVVASLQKIIADNRNNLDAIFTEWAKMMPKARQVAEDLKTITGQITSGEGTIGKLVMRDAIGDKAEAALDGFNQRLEEIKPITAGFTQLQMIAGLRGGYNLRSGSSRYEAYIRIEPKPWKLYEGGMSYRGAPSERHEQRPNIIKINGVPFSTAPFTSGMPPDEDFAMDFDLLFGWRFFPVDDWETYILTVKGGFLDSHIGGQVDVGLWRDRLSASIMVRDKDSGRWERERRYEGGSGVLGRATLNYRIWEGISVYAGVDDIFATPGPFIGLQAELRDNDIRNLITAAGLMP